MPERGGDTMQELYRKLDELNYDRDNELVTVIRGAQTGTKMLLTDGKVVWPSDPEKCPDMDALPQDAVYREKLGHIQTLVVCGAGTVGLCVIRLGKFLGWRVVSVEDREEFAKQAETAGSDEVLCGEFSGILSGIAYDSDTFFVVVTREHSYDMACLGEILKHPFGYLGMMGSHKRTAKMRRSLTQEGWPQDLIDRLHAPIGLSIEAQTPEEIAVSIAAEMILEKERRTDRYHFPDDILRKVREVLQMQEENPAAHAVLATITRQIGSTPRKAGARMLVLPDGSIIGTIGGGSMEAEVIRRSVEGLLDPASYVSSLLTVDLTGRSGAWADMDCGGITDVFMELI